MKRFMQFILLTSLLPALTGCGNLMNQDINRKVSLASYDPNRLMGSVDSGANESDPNYTCATSENIKPDYDYDLNGSGHYTACPSKTNKTDLALHGTSSSPRICSFPVQQIDPQHIYTKPDLKTGAPMFSCNDASSAVYLSFSGITFNALFVVDEYKKDQMLQCMITQNFSACPTFSYGKFR